MPEASWTTDPEGAVDQITQEKVQNALLFYPTSTIWGLGADIVGKGVDLLGAVKPQRKQKPYLLVWCGKDDLLAALTKAPNTVRRTIETYCYQPVTMVLCRRWFVTSMNIPGCCISHEEKIAVRVDGLNSLGNLMRVAGSRAWISTSANIEGQPTPTTVNERSELFLRAPCPRILFSYSSPLPGIPSTIIDLETNQVLRQGAAKRPS